MKLQLSVVAFALAIVASAQAQPTPRNHEILPGDAKANSSSVPGW
jgi:hypothetical protein